MKKVFSFVAVAAMTVALFSCGGAATEEAVTGEAATEEAATEEAATEEVVEGAVVEAVETTEEAADAAM